MKTFLATDYFPPQPPRNHLELVNFCNGLTTPASVEAALVVLRNSSMLWTRFSQNALLLWKAVTTAAPTFILPTLIDTHLAAIRRDGSLREDRVVSSLPTLAGENAPDKVPSRLALGILLEHLLRKLENNQIAMPKASKLDNIVCDLHIGRYNRIGVELVKDRPNDVIIVNFGLKTQQRIHLDGREDDGLRAVLQDIRNAIGKNKKDAALERELIYDRDR